ncbi:unnamed protein product [Lactuca virosa]|uniref:Secreted protein n=1 Tax=Lactuca virosa TaxID=75947 RepID=A0AAU9LRM2_9ASTR|nr:unnamed protein product [Lactuca virosa]
MLILYSLFFSFEILSFGLKEGTNEPPSSFSFTASPSSSPFTTPPSSSPEGRLKHTGLSEGRRRLLKLLCEASMPYVHHPTSPSDCFLSPFTSSGCSIFFKVIPG